MPTTKKETKPFGKTIFLTLERKNIFLGEVRDENSFATGFKIKQLKNAVIIWGGRNPLTGQDLGEVSVGDWISEPRAIELAAHPEFEVTVKEVS